MPGDEGTKKTEFQPRSRGFSFAGFSHGAQGLKPEPKPGKPGCIYALMRRVPLASCQCLIAREARVAALQTVRRAFWMNVQRV